MATRSIIAVPTKSGWKGRYCHWDGYPDAKVTELLLLSSRDGLEKARKTLMAHSWSALIPSQTELDEKRADYEKEFVIVDGYGIAYNDKPHSFTNKSKSFAWAEYLYVLGDNDLSVYQAVNTGDTTLWKPVKKHNYLRTKVLL